MSFKTTLFRAINGANNVVCEGFEIDGFALESDSYRLMCGDDDIARFLDQEIEVDDMGYAMATTTPMFDHEEGFDDNEEPRQAQLRFTVSVPLTPAYLGA